MIILELLSVKPSNFGDFLHFTDSYIWWKDPRESMRFGWHSWLFFFWWLHVDLIRCKHAKSWKWKNFLDLPPAVYLYLFCIFAGNVWWRSLLNGRLCHWICAGIAGSQPPLCSCNFWLQTFCCICWAWKSTCFSTWF